MQIVEVVRKFMRQSAGKTTVQNRGPHLRRWFNLSEPNPSKAASHQAARAGISPEYCEPWNISHRVGSSTCQFAFRVRIWRNLPEFL